VHFNGGKSGDSRASAMAYEYGSNPPGLLMMQSAQPVCVNGVDGLAFDMRLEWRTGARFSFAKTTKRALMPFIVILS
jgi:hypothetical protein